MMSDEHEITLFAETNFRGVKRRFGIKRNDRRRHMYMIGKTGMGKTTLLENMTIQDIHAGEGVGIVDPHGEYAEKMLDFIPASRINDVVYFNPSDLNNPIAFNVMEDVGVERRHLVATGLIGVFKKIWPDVWSGRMEYLLSNSILALLETPGTTLLGINRILADKEYRKQIVGNTTDPIVRAFWENEYAKYSDKFATEAGAAVQNKIGQFTSNPLIRNIIGQPKSTIDMRRIMDEKKIFIMNLSKGRIGEENSKLLGAMLITRLYLAAMTRVEIADEAKRADFYLYVDEFQNFATESFASILSEARKYRLDLILAHQYVEQMDETVRAAVFGNVGTMLTFRVGAADAELLEKEMSPEFLIKDIVNLGFANIYLRLMIDGVASRPFSATTLPPVRQQERSYKNEIIESSRKLYARDRKIIDKEIIDWQGLTKSMGQHGERQISAEKPIFARRELSKTPPVQEAVSNRNYAERIPSNERPLRAIQQQPLRRESQPVVNAVNDGAGNIRGWQKEERPPQTISRVQGRAPSKIETEQRHGFYGQAPSARRAMNINLRQTDEIKIYPKRTAPVAGDFGKNEPSSPLQTQTKKPLFKSEPSKKPENFMLLSELNPKAIPANQKKSEPKKTINFTELKKILAESFVPQKPIDNDSESGALRDRTGMLKPRDTAQSSDKQPETKILKPGDKITF